MQSIDVDEILKNIYPEVDEPSEEGDGLEESSASKVVDPPLRKIGDIDEGMTNAFDMKGGMATKAFVLLSKNISKTAIRLYLYFLCNCHIKSGRTNNRLNFTQLSQLMGISYRMLQNGFYELFDNGFITERTHQGEVPNCVLMV